MQGQTEEPVKVQLPEYDPKCYLCPGNKRMGAGETNPHYHDTYVSPPSLLNSKLRVSHGHS